MRTYTFNKDNYKNYREFYEDFYKIMEVSKYNDYDGCTNLNYSADILWEFLSDGFDYDLHIIMKNVDLEKLKEPKNIDDYKWSIIIEVLQDFARLYPNNKVEFVND